MVPCSFREPEGEHYFFSFFLYGNVQQERQNGMKAVVAPQVGRYYDRGTASPDVPPQRPLKWSGSVRYSTEFSELELLGQGDHLKPPYLHLNDTTQNTPWPSSSRHSTSRVFSPASLTLLCIFFSLQKTGGFGEVFKVKNNLDGCVYAVKKIPLQDKVPNGATPPSSMLFLVTSLTHLSPLLGSKFPTKNDRY